MPRQVTVQIGDYTETFIWHPEGWFIADEIAVRNELLAAFGLKPENDEPTIYADHQIHGTLISAFAKASSASAKQA